MNTLLKPLDIQHFLYTPLLALRTVRPTEFRTTIAYEDLVQSIQYDAKELAYEIDDKEVGKLAITGIYELENPIQIFDTYNPFANYIHVKREADALTEKDFVDFEIKGYENPGLANRPTKRFMCVAGWMAVINQGIDAHGMKKLVSYIRKNHTQIHVVTHEKLTEYMEYLMTKEPSSILEYLEDTMPNSMKSRGVFYANNSQYYQVEKEYYDLPNMESSSTAPIEPKKNCGILAPMLKAKITSAYLYKRLKRDKRALISTGIAVLRDVDTHTKITDARLSKVTSLDKMAVKRAKSFRQKRLIDKVNVDRPFKTELKATKYMIFVQSYDRYKSMKVAAVLKHLSINYNTYYEYIEIMKSENRI